MKTTLNKIRECDPCTGGWKKLLAHLGKNKADDKPLSILTVLDSNGLDDALWCLRAVEDQDRVIRLYGVWCASQVKHLMADQRSLNALDVAERFANAEATTEDLAAARDAARAAAWAAARDAAWDAARDAAWDAARAAAWDAAWAAAWDAASALARDEELDAARAAARDAQSEELRRVCAAIDAGADPYPSKVPA